MFYNSDVVTIKIIIFIWLVRLLDINCKLINLMKLNDELHIQVEYMIFFSIF